MVISSIQKQEVVILTGFICSGLTIQANMYYKMLISWTSQKVKETYATHNAFDFKNGNYAFNYLIPWGPVALLFWIVVKTVCCIIPLRSNSTKK